MREEVCGEEKVCVCVEREREREGEGERERERGGEKERWINGMKCIKIYIVNIHNNFSKLPIKTMFPLKYKQGNK